MARQPAGFPAGFPPGGKPQPCVCGHRAEGQACAVSHGIAIEGQSRDGGGQTTNLDGHVTAVGVGQSTCTDGQPTTVCGGGQSTCTDGQPTTVCGGGQGVSTDGQPTTVCGGGQNTCTDGQPTTVCGGGHGSTCDGQGTEGQTGTLTQGLQWDGAIASDGHTGRLTQWPGAVAQGPQWDGAIASDGQSGRLTHGTPRDGHTPHTDGAVTGGSGCCPPGAAPPIAPARWVVAISPTRKSACAACDVTEPCVSVASAATQRIVPASSGSSLE
ncbi:MAG: hypothetical protein M3071_04910 [Actinomycetota bacterium]|nr:hypothetical protein [Actinomycetota bacterium]